MAARPKPQAFAMRELPALRGRCVNPLQLVRLVAPAAQARRLARATSMFVVLQMSHARRADPLRPERRQWDLAALLAFVRGPAALA